jgi:hypothetical protein
MPPTPETDAPRTRLRQLHGVRRVEPHEEGFAAENLPPGIFGFTGSPALASPLFAEQRYRNFEVHRTADGDVVLIAFVTSVDAQQLAASTGPVRVLAFPDAEGEASVAVAISYSRIVHHRQYSVRNAASISLEVRPFAQPASV